MRNLSVSQEGFAISGKRKRKIALKLLVGFVEIQIDVIDHVDSSS